MGKEKKNEVKDTMREEFEEFASDTTCHGIGRLVQARNLVFKLLWFCALCCAVIIMGRQVILLFIKYFNWDKITKVEVKNDAQDFPTVTICNLNPFRKSAIVNSSQSAIQKLRGAYLDLKQEEERIERLEALHRIANIGNQRRAYNKSSSELNSTASNTPQIAMHPVSIEYDLIDNEEEVKNKTVDRLLREALQIAAMEIPYTSMKKFGHRVEDMVHWCRFLGRFCSYQNFSQYLNYQYGNCYSFNSAQVRDKAQKMGRSGTKYGLTMVLNVEKDEYLPVLSSGTGVHILIHRFGTQPFPVHEGYSVPAGFETKFAVTVRNIKRLSDPYGKCRESLTDDDGNLYTVTSCVNQCVHLAVLKRCGCYRYGAKHYLPKQYHNNKTKPCTMDKDIKCYLTINQNYARQNFECDCLQPCTETEYSATSDLNEWPSEGYVSVLQDVVCRNPAAKSTCSKIKQKGREFIRKNFMAVTVFFKQLNYELIREEEEYLLEDLLSDIGGTLGLYAGISLMTGIEFLALAGRMFHILLRRWMIVRDTSQTNVKIIDEHDNPALSYEDNFPKFI